MLMPSIFGENLFDNWMDFPFHYNYRRNSSPWYTTQNTNLMKTDVKETDGNYEVDIDLPGFKKEDIKAKLENGYLTVSATKNTSNDEKDEEGKYIRQERYSGSMSRSFYVGDAVTQDEIKAKYEDGILKLTIPKKDAKAVEAKKHIAIEG